MTQNQPQPSHWKQSHTSIVVVLGKPRCSPLKMAKLRSIQKFLEISSIPVTMRSQFWGIPGIFFFFLSLIYDCFFFFFSFHQSWDCMEYSVSSLALFHLMCYCDCFPHSQKAIENVTGKVLYITRKLGRCINTCRRLKKPLMSSSAAAAAKSPQSCPTLCDPIDGGPPGSPIPGILQARTVERVAISFSSA